MKAARRVLIISYYWPPSAGSGVQRWLKFCKYLPKYGWEPVIYTPENPTFDIRDYSLLNDISPNIEVVKTKIWEPYGLLRIIGNRRQSNVGKVESSTKQGVFAKLLNWVRGNVFIPDPRKFWVKPSVRFLSKYLEQNPVDVIITTGPPHSMHLIGLGLKKKLNIKWIMDIRDPWSKLDFLDSFHLSDKSKAKYSSLEKECLTNADHIIGTSYSMPEMLLDFNHNKYTCITNGYDEEDFADASPPDAINKNWVLYHAGLLNDLRNPIELWGALDQLLTENDELNQNFKLHLAGNISDSVIHSIQSFDALKNNVLLEGYKSHRSVLDDYQNADALLLVINNTENYKVNIPGKLFEYIAAKKPILSVGQVDADANKIIMELGCGIILQPGDKADKVKDLLRQFLTTNFQLSGGKQFTRKNLSSNLASVLNQLIS